MAATELEGRVSHSRRQRQDHRQSVAHILAIFHPSQAKLCPAASGAVLTSTTSGQSRLPHVGQALYASKKRSTT